MPVYFRIFKRLFLELSAHYEEISIAQQFVNAIQEKINRKINFRRII